MDGLSLTIRDDEGANAIDLGQLLDVLSGRGVISGGAVHEASEPFAVQVLAVDGWFADSTSSISESQTDGDTTIGTPVQRPSATISLRDWVDDTHPRKVLICLPKKRDGNVAGGDFHVIAGEPEQAKPSDFGEYWATAEPSLPDLSDSPDLIPLAAGWIGANADDVTENNLWQRRQRPDVALRQAFVSEIIAASLTDGAGVTHGGEIADAGDIRTNQEILDVVGPTLDYFTADEARGAVRGNVDVADLSGAAGTDGQLPFSTGSAVNWATPPDEWGSLQAAIDAAVAAGVTPAFDDLETADETVTKSITWPDGTTTTQSPQAAAGNVAVLADLGDVQRGAASDRRSPSGSGDVFFATAETNDAGEPQTRGIAYDNPANDPAAWDWVAVHPGDIDAADLGFNVATQAELSSHTDRTDNPHGVTAGQAGALPEDGTATAAESAASAAKASALVDSEAGDGSTLTSDQVARSDESDAVAGIRTYKEPDESIHGPRSDAEIERWVGDTADYLVTIQGGTKRVNHVWNAYYDGSDWRYQVSDEPAHRLKISNGGGWDIQTASSSLSDEIISWETATIDNGSIDQADNADNAASLGGHPAGAYGRSRSHSDVAINKNFSYDHRVSFNTPEIRSSNSFGAYHIDIAAFGDYNNYTNPIYISLDGAVMNDGGNYNFDHNTITSINATDVRFAKDGTGGGDVAVLFDENGASLQYESRVWGDLWLTRPVR